MNEDFFLDHTPALARRLKRLAEIRDIEIDPAILARADEGLLGAAAFDALAATLNERQRAAVQFVHDCRFRAVLPSTSGENIEVALASAIIANLRPILLVTMRTTAWTIAARAFGLSFSIDERDNPDIIVRTYDDAIEQALLYKRRGGLALIDYHMADFRVASGIAHEFEKCLVLGDPTRPKPDLAGEHPNASPWTSKLATMVSVLFDTDASVLENDPARRRRWLASRGYRKTHPRDVGFMFNVMTELLPEPANAAQEEATVARINEILQSPN